MIDNWSNYIQRTEQIDSNIVNNILKRVSLQDIIKWQRIIILKIVNCLWSSQTLACHHLTLVNSCYMVILWSMSSEWLRHCSFKTKVKIWNPNQVKRLCNWQKRFICHCLSSPSWIMSTCCHRSMLGYVLKEEIALKKTVFKIY